MAFVGPVHLGIPPVAVYCEVCNDKVLCWPCYNCSGRYCGHCIFKHGIVPGVSLCHIKTGRVDANEVAEGMHRHWRNAFLRQTSEMAMDPAGAAFCYGQGFLCKRKGMQAFEIQILV